MSYNVEFHSAGEPTTLDAIGAQQADIVALQEMTFDTQALLEERYGALYPYQLYQSAGGTSGLAVLSRFELTDQGVRPGPNGWHPAWHVRVDVPGVPLQLLNVHLRSVFSGSPNPLASLVNTGEDHLFEIEDFSAQCDSGLSNLVVGDFNEGTNGQAVTFLERSGFENILPEYHPGQPTWRFRSIGNQLEETFDHILYDGSLRPLNAWVKVIGHSDHLPVMAQLEARSW
jgi:endonuclease/exonuclease/phosphatase family metal-dependent hydrolase